MIVTVRKERRAGAQAAAMLFGATTLCAALLPHRERALMDLGTGTPAVFGAQAVDDVTYADAQTGYVPTGIAIGSTGSPRTAGRQRLIPGLPRAAGIPGIETPAATAVPTPPQLALNNLPPVLPLGGANSGGGDLGSSTGGIGSSGGDGFSGFPGGSSGGSSSGGSVNNPGFDASSTSTSTGGSSTSTGGDPGGSSTSTGGSTTSSTSSTSTGGSTSTSSSTGGDPGGSTSSTSTSSTSSSTGGSTSTSSTSTGGEPGGSTSTSSTSSSTSTGGDPGGSTSTGGDPGGSSGMVSPVPEPSSWLMMIMGFGFIGAMLRRARQRRRISAATSGARQS